MSRITYSGNALAALVAAGLLAGCAQTAPKSATLADAIKSHGAMECCKEKMGPDGKPMPCKCCAQKSMAGAAGAAPQMCMDQMSKKSS